VKTTGFQKLAIAALASVLVLMFVGATVRVSGSGMGCPDWPKCWGRLIPPTSAEQVDFEALPIEVFQRKAKWLGRDPAEVTPETLREIFNPRHVWTEFINRLTSLPVGFFAMAVLVASCWQMRRRPWVFVCALASVIVIGINAWMGRNIIHSGLQPGVITTHLALAMGLLGLQMYVAWAGTSTPWRVAMQSPAAFRATRIAVAVLLCVIVLEGIGGAQVRELTDELSRQYKNAPRETWTDELESSWWYITHRSFSWVVLAATVTAWGLTRRHRVGGAGLVEHAVFGIVLMQMVLGIIMAQIRIFAWVQVLHVGLAALLLALTWLWWFGLTRQKNAAAA
jgi:cytochrome c oxidase assembly protein subunit 15